MNWLTSNLALLTILLFSVTQGDAQTFNKRYGQFAEDGASYICHAATIIKEEIFIATNEQYDAPFEISIYRIDFQGNLQETYSLNNPDIHYYQGWADFLQTSVSGDLIYGGIGYQPFVLEPTFGHIVKITDSGAAVWHKLYGDSLNNHRFAQVKCTFDRGFIATGSAELSSSGRQIYVVKTDSLGNEEWTTYLGDNNWQSGVYVNQFHNLEGYVISGFSNPTPYTRQGIVLTLDNEGQVLHSRWFPNWSFFDDQMAKGVISCSQGGFVFSTRYNTDEPYTQDDYYAYPQLVKLNDSLETEWICDFPELTSGRLDVSVVKEASDGGFVFCGFSGQSYVENGAVTEGFIAKVSSSGNQEWIRRYTHAQFGINEFYDLDLMPGGGFLCTGNTLGVPAAGDTLSGQHAWLLRVDSLGCLVPGCDTIISVSEIEPIEFSVYPNPADDFINVAFSKHLSAKDARLEVYDMQGRKVKETKLLHEKATYMLDSSGLPSGNYILKLRTKDFQKAEQIIIQH